jgi:hypothetical protein
MPGFSQVSFATEPGEVTSANEDWCGASPSTVVLLDGVTSPPELPTGCRHSVPWYVATLGAEILRATGVTPDRPLDDCLATAIFRTTSLHRESCDVEHPGTPSATVGVARLASDTLDYLVLSDTTCVVRDGNRITAHCDRSADLVNRVERSVIDRLAAGSTAHRKATLDFIRAQQKLRNSAGGYWLAAADPRAAEYALTGTVSCGRDTQVALLSDGAACLVEVYREYTWAGLMTMMRTGGPRGVIAAVRAVERTDQSGRRWPRLKPSDDATALLAYCQQDYG